MICELDDVEPDSDPDPDPGRDVINLDTMRMREVEPPPTP